MDVSRRTALIGLVAGAMQLLFTKRLIAAGTGSTAAPGSLNLALAALTPGLLRISFSPGLDEPRTEELGVVDGTWRELGKAGLEKSDTVTWGKYTLKVTAGDVSAYGRVLPRPVRCDRADRHTAPAGGRLRRWGQELQLPPSSCTDP
jgi:hypothetical protein